MKNINVVYGFKIQKFFLRHNWKMNLSASTVQPVLYGYDMVAYFTESKPVMGDPEISYVFETEDCGLNEECVPRFNSTFYFSTKENRDAFVMNPWKYAPRWGGF